MRLARLDLVRYGKFTGRTLDFGPAPQGMPDLHVVYGPNEAGKSTAFAAYLDLLFGIRATREPNYAFLHPYPTMRIGARLDLSGRAHEFARIRRAQATLLGADDRPADEGPIAAALAGVGREAYRAMFSLDDASLEEGGEEILASKGDLGQLLFSGSAGAAGLSQALDRLRTEADTVFKPKSGSTELGALRKRLDDLKAERVAVDTQASLYRQHLEARTRAEAGYGAALAARAAVEARRREIERQLAALPRLDELRGAREAAAAFADLPRVPPGMAAALPDLQRREIALDTESAALDRDVATLEREIEGIAVDPAALAAAAAYDSLAALGERVRSAAEDLPKRRQSVAENEAAIASGLIRLGRPPGSDPSAIAIAAGTTGALRGLVAERSGVGEGLRRARHEAAEALRALAELRDAIPDAETLTAEQRRSLQRLGGAVEALQGTDAPARLRAAERALPPRAAALADAIKSLAPWSGSFDDLRGLVLPEPSEIEAWASELRDRSAESERRANEAERLADERERLRAEVDALGTVAGVVSEAEAIAVRVERDRAWSRHRARLDAESADIFADALARDDLVTGARFGRAAETARLKQAALNLAGVEVALRQAAEREADARRRLHAIQATFAAALARISPPLPPDTTPSRFGAWMTRRTAALAALTAVQAAERDVAEARADLAAARDRLGAALAEAAVAHEASAPLDLLLATARDATARGRAAEGSADRLAECERQAKARTRALGDAEALLADWQARWTSTCAACWLGAGQETPSAEAVGEILDVLGELAPELRTRDDLRHRVAAMDADARDFAERILPLATALGLDASLPALDLDRAVAARIRAAREAHRALLDRNDRLSKARARRAEADAAAAANRAAGDPLRRLFGVETLAEVAAKLAACAERDRRLEQAEAAARAILRDLHESDLSKAEATLGAVDPRDLEAERDDLAARYDAADAELRDHHARRLDAEARLAAIGGDEAAARIEGERRTTLLEIEDAALRYLRLSAGVAAAEIALRTYRDRHRSAMLAQASEAFRLVSRGAYRGLATQPGDKGADVLMAVAADGKNKAAAELSKGTRFQLYLALRAAGYHEFAKARGPVPFIADDIMETFDDFRAEEAFRLFAVMARVGQVVYLTHHRHLVEIARSACPAVRVQELDGA